MVQPSEEKGLLLGTPEDTDINDVDKICTGVTAKIAAHTEKDNSVVNDREKTIVAYKCKSCDDLYADVTIEKFNGLVLSKSTNFISNNTNEKNSSVLVADFETVLQQAGYSTTARHITINETSNRSETVALRLQHSRGHIYPEHQEIGPCRVVFQQRSYETSQSSESVICRICHSSGDDRLIAPCRCSGSSRYVHASCLVTWFKKSVKNQCELCKSDVKIRKINHNIALWRKPEDRPIPLIWFSVFFIGLFLNVLSIYVNASESCKSTACLIFYVVNGFGIILDAAFLWFWFHKCRHYWRKWCALNQDWFIDDLDEANDVHVEFVRSQDVQFV